MLVVTPAEQAALALSALGEGWIVGEVVAGEQVCVIRDP
jgi:hypothetical protein